MRTCGFSDVVVGGLGFGFSCPDQKDGAVKYRLGLKTRRVVGASPASEDSRPKVVSALVAVFPGNATVLDPSCGLRPGRSVDASKKRLSVSRVLHDSNSLR